ncbi:hypothetical protein ACFSO7_21950 [Bacillus sp. CGMCC 1.16607]|uniref:hypothetical protein n=1 Tax=Bacillus sp. CGMCC 1.16607 TaxID=3351842 RepID=UPI0036444BDA
MKSTFLDMILNQNYDLEEVRTRLDMVKMNIFNTKITEMPISLQDVHVDLLVLLDQMMPTYIGVAYHYNKYIDDLYFDISWDEIKYTISESEYVSTAVREAKFITNLQSVLTTIKTGLDRLVAIFSYYYNGFSSDTTFGHIKESGSFKGFMNTVDRLKKEDELMSYIYDQYIEWISFAVKPRNIIMHYNDLTTSWHYDSKLNCLIPIHTCKKVLGKEHKSLVFNFTTIRDYCEKWYKFFGKVFSYLANKDIIYSKTRI